MIKHSFKQYFAYNLLTEEKEKGVIKHLTHLEELVLTDQAAGIKLALSFITELLNTFKSNSDKSFFVTVKFDGAPSIIAGIDPETQRFFVATKSIANVTPKVNYTQEDIENNHSHAPGLAKKLSEALKHLPGVIVSGIYQGDFMYSRDDLKEISYQGTDYLTFKPNTILYAIEKDSLLGKRISKSKIGIVFHTKLVGNSLSTLQKQSNVSNNEFSVNGDVYLDDAKIKDLTGTVTLTKELVSLVEKNIDQINEFQSRIDWQNIPESLYPKLQTFINSLIRKGTFLTNPEEDYERLLSYIKEKAEKESEKLKTDTAKQKRKDVFEKFLQELEITKNDIIKIFEVSMLLEETKRIFIEKYDAAIKTKQFLLEPDGSLKVTSPEGYVAVDHVGNMVKLVSRLQFSAANFAVARKDKFQ